MTPDPLERLASQQFDLLVIGGGIIGAATAWLGARAGLSVALVERDDLGSWTSSASSKLIHGGLRYLQMGDVRLVREAHAERRALATVLAPQLVRPRRFIFPLYRGGPVRPLELRAGLALYGALSRFHDGIGAMLSPAQASELVPELKLDGLRAAGRYVDHETNDSRLVVLCARAAAAAGAVVATRLAVDGLTVAGGRVDGAECGDLRIRARTVVNASGPWVDELRRLADPGARPSVRLSKGVHAVAELREGWQAAVAAPLAGGRVQFANPWEGMLLVGTTDEAYGGDPAKAVATEADIDQIIRESHTALVDRVVTRETIRYTFAGLRVLPLGARGTTQSARREVVISTDPNGLISIAGGKYTTFRRIALGVLELAGVRPLDRSPIPLPGAADPEEIAMRLRLAHDDLSEPSIQHLARFHGSEAIQLALGDRTPIVEGSPEIAAEVAHARDHEWVRDADDFLRRRSTLAIQGRSELARARVEELLAR